jgi:hypothetical protein
VPHPSPHLPDGEAEGQVGEEGEGGLLAGEEQGGGLAALDGAGLHRVQHLEPGHDLPGREAADLELVVGEQRDAARHVLAPPKMMSMLRGKLLVRRQRISGFWVCAMAGAASAAGAAAAAAPRTRRRCMDGLPMLFGQG